MIDIRTGDCLEVLRTLADNSVDAIVTDPPYGLSFMGNRWDYDVPSEAVWREGLRVLKPGGHLLAFAGTRTQHRMAVRIEDAGFEIRDMIAWVYGSGFPKSLDVSKAIDKMDAAEEQERRRLAFTAWVRSQGVTARQIDEATGTNMGGHYTTAASQPAIMTREHLEACRHLFSDVPAWVEREADIRSVESRNMAEREVIGRSENGIAGGTGKHAGQDAAYGFAGEFNITAPATDAARQWQGWGTALKPALETVTFASKPYTPDQERDIIISNLIRLEARLWLLSSASAAEKSSTSSQSEYGAACAIAQWSAEKITNTHGALCDQMGTSLFELATNTSLSIVSSWRRTLAESLNDGSTSTIATKSSTTIDWRTLRFSLSQITPESIIKACSLPGGFSANASTAENHFNASLSLLQSIRTLSATEPAISLAQHEHLGAGVKPNLDPCIMARKPLVGTVAANVLEHGTGALNIDGCRIKTDDVLHAPKSDPHKRGAGAGEYCVSTRDTSKMHDAQAASIARTMELGRWPANVIHDGSDEVVAGFPTSASPWIGNPNKGAKGGRMFGGSEQGISEKPEYRDAGSAARFFYCAKASRTDRNEGCESLPLVDWTDGAPNNVRADQINTTTGERRNARPSRNHHPTVKPTDLMRYLCRLVTPPGGVVLDPFMGSGSTGKAAVLEGFQFIGIEINAGYAEIARRRVYAAAQETRRRKVDALTMAQGSLFA